MALRVVGGQPVERKLTAILTADVGERNADLPSGQRIEFRVGIDLGALPFEKVGRILLIRSRTSIAAICLIGAAAILLGPRAA